jgi:acylphosphatase
MLQWNTVKLKISITGPRVHDVGYRYFLMSNAIDLSLEGFHARNRDRVEAQEVIAIVEGDDDAVMDFRKLVEAKKPERSEVSNISFEDYTGKVMPTGEYAQVCTALQLNKAIPLLLRIAENTDMIPEMAEDVKGLREDLTQNTNKRLEGIERDMRVVKKKLGIR